MRILITGGFGFVGGRLAVHLAQAGHQIVLGSRNTIDPPSWLSQAEVAQIKWGDDRALLNNCNGVDVVIHAAGMNAQDCAADPAAALEFNGVATALLVEAASLAGVQRFIYLSTVHVYASPLVGTITENICPRNLHPYATSNLAGEHAVLKASQYGHMQGIVLRLSNAFGAPMWKGVNCWMLLINDLCRQAVETRRMKLLSRGLQHRDFVAMTEVCRVIEWLAANDMKERIMPIFNVASGVSTSVLAMAQLIRARCNQVLGFEPELEWPSTAAEDKSNQFSLHSKRLKIEGLRVSQEPTSEIDQLLRFCADNFDL